MSSKARKLRDQRNQPPEGKPFTWHLREMLESDAWRTQPLNTGDLWKGSRSNTWPTPGPPMAG
jgi:hypothetical protein